MRTIPNWAIAYLGILYRGAVVTPLDPAATTQALATFLGNSEAKLAFVSPASLMKFRAACEQLGRNIPAVALLAQLEPDGLAKFEDWARHMRQLPIGFNRGSLQSVGISNPTERHASRIVKPSAN